MVRKVDFNGNYAPFSVLETNMGWFGQSTSDIADELNIGIAIYFKQLKSLGLFFLICALISLPSLLLFSIAVNHRTDNIDLNPLAIFKGVSLGNLGQNQ
jgi:hypothetical protein